LSEWSETATCIGVKTNKEKMLFTAPWGTEDLFHLNLRKIPNYIKIYKHDPNLFFKRIESKKWLEKWPKLKVITN
jgi:hypothetical protein